MSGGRTGAVRGFTLVELLVAMTVFLTLGVLLVQLVNAGLDTVRAGERRRAPADRARVVLDLLMDDLEAAWSGEPVAGEDRVARWIGDFSWPVGFNPSDGQPPGLARLRLVRTLAGEMQNPYTREAGQAPADAAGLAADLVLDHSQAFPAGGGASGIRAPGGLAEVAWVLAKGSAADPWETLYRIQRSPAGGAPPAFASVPGSEWRSLFDPAFWTGTPPPQAHPVVDRVLYLGLRYWHQYCRTPQDWDPATASSPDAAAFELWDSSRASGATPDTDPDWRGDSRAGATGFTGTPLGAATLWDASDDVYPEQVRVTLVLAPDPEREVPIHVIQDSGASILLDTDRGFVKDPPNTGAPGSRQYVRIGDEWIWYTSAAGTTLSGCTRGTRNTVEVPHPKGTRVWIGQTWEVTVEIPCYREDWR